MEYLPKETLIKIINDLECELKDQDKNDNSSLIKENEELNKNIEKLQIIEEQYKGLEKDYQEKSLKLTETIQINKKLEKENYKLKKNSAGRAAERTDPDMEEDEMTTEQRCNMLNFIQKFCYWTAVPINIEAGIGYVKVAPGSTIKLHENLRAWAIENGIPTKGKDRGIPDKPSFVKYMKAEQIERFSNQNFTPRERWEFPFPYWGTYTSPRINLRLNRTFT